MSSSRKSKEKHGENGAAKNGWGRLSLLTLTSLGVVYGDIGTSPLYAVRECFFGQDSIQASPANVLGVLSLITWSLILIISVKYLLFVLRADNDGEGGILALMELARRHSKHKKTLLSLGLFGAALLYGDGMITPAISVLSAVEGLKMTTGSLQGYLAPITVGILVLLFVMQQVGTAGIGKLFGPIMLIWFGALAATGALGVSQHPEVLGAINPAHGLFFLRNEGMTGFFILGIVFLVVTGGEALYADIGHLGVAPIRIGWYGLVLPCLLLNYFGQGALILSSPNFITNPFYQLVPGWALYPMVVLATIATVIASQAVISGAFSLTFQAVHLGYLPYLKIRHTSPEQRGQTYVPIVNWVLLIATVGLVLGFQESGNLAAAYGVAITTTMVITTLLFFVVMRKLFAWPLVVALSLTGIFLTIDLAFFAANMRKFIDGGWFPLLVAAFIFLIMTTWCKGFAIERRKNRNRIQRLPQFLIDIGGGGKYRRVPGQAVYLADNARGIPRSLRHNLSHNRALHSLIIIYTASFVKAPRVPRAKRFKVTPLREDIFRVVVHYGYTEVPNVPEDLEAVRVEHGIGLDLSQVTYFVGGEMLLADNDIGMMKWRSWLYAFMARNQSDPTEYFNLPPKQVFEIGTQIQV